MNKNILSRTLSVLLLLTLVSASYCYGMKEQYAALSLLLDAVETPCTNAKKFQDIEKVKKTLDSLCDQSKEMHNLLLKFSDNSILNIKQEKIQPAIIYFTKVQKAIITQIMQKIKNIKTEKTNAALSACILKVNIFMNNQINNNPEIKIIRKVSLLEKKQTILDNFLSIVKNIMTLEEELKKIDDLIMQDIGSIEEEFGNEKIEEEILSEILSGTPSRPKKETLDNILDAIFKKEIKKEATKTHRGPRRNIASKKEPKKDSLEDKVKLLQEQIKQRDRLHRKQANQQQQELYQRKKRLSKKIMFPKKHLYFNSYVPKN
jgi:hypothetical protein